MAYEGATLVVSLELTSHIQPDGEVPLVELFMSAAGELQLLSDLPLSEPDIQTLFAWGREQLPSLQKSTSVWFESHDGGPTSHLSVVPD